MNGRDVSACDQLHAALRDAVGELGLHVRHTLIGGVTPSEAALEMGCRLTQSPHTRQLLAYLLGASLVEAEIRAHRRRP